MRFDGICLITEDVPRLAAFYARILHSPAEGDDVHCEVRTEGGGLAIYSKAVAERDMGFRFDRYWGAGNLTIGFTVSDVDEECQALRALGVEFVAGPATYPWGASAVHFRDPDGNIVCFRSRSR